MNLRRQTTLASLLLALLLVAGCFSVLALSGCALIPQKSERVTHRQSCRQALEQGWCYDGCRKKPEYCCPPKDVRCSPDGMCTWRGCDGSLIFGALR